MARIYAQFGTGKTIVITGNLERFIKAQERLMKKFNMSPKEWNTYVSPVIYLARETIK